MDEKRTAEEQRREEDRGRRRKRKRREEEGSGLRLPRLSILKWPILAAGALAVLLFLAGLLEPLMPWSRKAKLEAARDSLVVLEASRDSLGALVIIREVARDSALEVAQLDQEEAEQSRLAADRLRSTNQTQRRIIARLRDAPPAATPEGQVEQLEIIIVAQEGLIDSLEIEIDTLRSAFESQKLAAAGFKALADSIDVELAETRVDRDRYQAVAIKFDEASGCGFPGNLIGCPSSTTIALLTAGVVLVIERLVVDHGNPEPIVIINQSPENPG